MGNENSYYSIQISNIENSTLALAPCGDSTERKQHIKRVRQSRILQKYMTLVFYLLSIQYDLFFKLWCRRLFQFDWLSGRFIIKEKYIKGNKSQRYVNVRDTGVLSAPIILVSFSTIIPWDGQLMSSRSFKSCAASKCISFPIPIITLFRNSRTIIFKSIWPILLRAPQKEDWGSLRHPGQWLKTRWSEMLEALLEMWGRPVLCALTQLSSGLRIIQPTSQEQVSSGAPGIIS